MTDPTPEERADDLWDWLNGSFLRDYREASAKKEILEVIRAAVKAETKPRDAYIKFLTDRLKDAEAFLAVHGCVVSQGDIDEGERMRAAIRRGPDD